MAIDKPLHLFSDSTSLRLGYYSDQTKYVSIQASSVGGLTLTPSVAGQTVAFANTARLSAVSYKRTGITQSTAGSTALTARGVIELGTSSTTAAANWILSVPEAGEEFIAVVKLNGSTFGVTINASTATAVTFGAVAATTGQIRATIPGVLGNYLSAVALSSAQWLVTGHQGVTFSTAAA